MVSHRAVGSGEKGVQRTFDLRQLRGPVDRGTTAGRETILASFVQRVGPSDQIRTRLPNMPPVCITFSFAA